MPQHLPDLARDVVIRKYPVIVPGLIKHAGDPRVSEVRERMKADVVVDQRRDSQYEWNNTEESYLANLLRGGR